MKKRPRRPRARSSRIGRRIWGLYIVKNEGRLRHAYQITPLKSALRDIVQAANKVDAVKTHPGEVMTEAKALDRLCEILCTDDLREAAPGHLLRIPLDVNEDHIQYRKRTGHISSANLLTPYDTYTRLRDQIDRAVIEGVLEMNFNAVAVVHERGTSGAKRTTQTRKIILSTWEVIPPPRIELEKECEIYRVQLLLSKPIFEYYKTPGHLGRTY
ncbi:hypothetical protein GF371_01785 [Candidatus Woesearchaeota archaeon]|nr:hypothetical protein [Candidatus Woesearchaeota archaeon]